jgi:hypothetical protein
MLSKLGYLLHIYWLKLYKHFVYLNSDGGDNARWYNFYHPYSGVLGGLTFAGLGLIVFWLIMWLIL